MVWGTGVFGLAILALLFTAWLVRGVRGPTLADVLATLPIGVPCVYYLIVAERSWTRKLWHAGIVIHFTTMAFVVYSLLKFGGISCVLWPVILVGPPAWTLFALRHKFDSTQAPDS